MSDAANDAQAGSGQPRMPDWLEMNSKVVDAWKSLGERKLFYRGLTSWMGFRHEQILGLRR